MDHWLSSGFIVTEETREGARREILSQETCLFYQHYEPTWI
jgi:hypothetical protein